MLLSDPAIATRPQEAAATTPLVLSVVLNWQRPDETLACVRALLHSDYPNQRVLVVDNSAGAANLEAVLAGLKVEIIRNPENLGAAGGVNVGLRHALAVGADYAWLVNSDAIAPPDTLARLVAAAEADPRIGMVSPIFHDTEARDTPALCLSVFEPLAQVVAQTASPEEAQRWLAGRPDDIVMANTALLVRRAVIETIGETDERFFVYVEDTEYSLRCREAGFRLVTCFDAVVYHRFTKPAHALAPLYYFMTRNYLLLWRKRRRRWLASKATLWFLHERLRQIARMPQQPAAIDALLAGLWDGLRGIGGPHDPASRAPWWLRRTLGRHPRLFLALLDRRLPFRRR